MSSVARNYAQLRGRSGIQASTNWIAVAAGTGYTEAQLRTALAMTQPPLLLVPTPSVINVTDASAFLGTVSSTAFAVRTNFRDMGKSLVIQSRGHEVFRFVLLQPIRGPSTEGVPDDYPTANLYVCVESADPYTKTVSIARV